MTRNLNRITGFAAWCVCLCLGLASAFAFAQTPANTAAQTQTHFLYRTAAGDTLQKIAFHLLQNPTLATANQAIVSANDWTGKPQSKSNFVFEAGTPVRVPTALMLQSPAPALLLQVTGEVQVVHADKTAVPATANAAINEGARLLLGATGRALVVFPDESRMDVQAGSSVTFAQLRRYSHTSIFMIDVQLDQGRMEASVNPKRDLAGRFNVQSRRTVTGVRGTVFRIGDATGEPAVVEVLKGEVGFSAAGATVAVPRGKGSFLDPNGKPAQPVSLLAAPSWVGSAAPGILLKPTDAIPLTLPPGTMSLMLELTAAQPGATTRNIELKASRALVLPADIPMGHYAFVAKAVDTHGLQGQPLESHIQLLAPPFPPSVLSLNSTHTRLQWTAAPQALLYVLEIYPEPPLAASAAAIQTRTPHHYVDVSQLPAGKYRARVATLALQVNSQASAAPVTEKVGSPSEWFSFERK